MLVESDFLGRVDRHVLDADVGRIAHDDIEAAAGHLLVELRVPVERVDAGHEGG